MEIDVIINLGNLYSFIAVFSQDTKIHNVAKQFSEDFKY